MAVLGSGVRYNQLLEMVRAPSKDACILWPYGANSAGYGIIWLHGKSLRATRIVYALVHGALADSDVVRHDCDTPACINPLHLRRGTTADNVADRVARRRGSHGSKHPKAKLNEIQVGEIRASKLNSTELADKYGVSAVMIGLIKRGKFWRHCPS